jgi:hypothetical protein
VTVLLLTLVLLYAPTVEVRDPTAHRIIAAVTVAVVSRDADEARDLYRLAHVESRWRNRARSPKGCCGLWQQQPRYRNTTCRALQTRPVHAALLAVRTWRAMGRLCGHDGQLRCYQRGPNHPTNARYRTDRRGW